jgi:hypothetical protein
MVKRRLAVLMHLTRWRVLAAGLALGAILSFSLPAWAKSYGIYETPCVGLRQDAHNITAASPWEASKDAGRKNTQIHLARKKKRSPGTEGDLESNWEDYQSLTPEEKAKIRQKQREWESLSPERKRMLRQRMEQLKRLPPQDRDLFRRRFNQWQELSPRERRGIRKNLERWDRLSPREQEKIRRRFLN